MYVSPRLQGIVHTSDVLARKDPSIDRHRQRHRSGDRGSVDLLLHDFRQVAHDERNGAGDSLGRADPEPVDAQRGIARHLNDALLRPRIVLFALRVRQWNPRTFKPAVSLPSAQVGCEGDALGRERGLARLVEIVSADVKRNVGAPLSSWREHIGDVGLVSGRGHGGGQQS